MSRSSVENAIRTRWDANFAAYPTQHDNQGDFTKPNDALWVRFNVRSGQTAQVSIGEQKRFRTAGVVIAQVFVPAHDGTGTAMLLADLVDTYFRAVTASGVTYLTPSVEHVGLSGAYWQTNITIPFRADALD